MCSSIGWSDSGRYVALIDPLGVIDGEQRLVLEQQGHGLGHRVGGDEAPIGVEHALATG